MATNVLLPQWGMNMEDGTLTRWLVNEGDEIAEGQPLVEVETAKINSELESPATGVVSHIMAAEGSLVKVGELVAVIGEPGENPPRPEPGAPTSPAAVTTAPETRPRAPRTRRRSTPGHPSRQAAGTRQQHRPRRGQRHRPHGAASQSRTCATPSRPVSDLRGSRVQVVPRARQLARQEDIDLADVTGSGPNGRIVVADVEQSHR